MNKKLVFSIIGGLLLLAGLGAGLFLVQQQQELRDKAAPATSLSFSPASPSIGVGETVDVSIQINTSENSVSSLDIDIGFDPNVVSVEKMVASNSFPVVLIAPQISNTNGSAKITVGASPSTPFEGTGVTAIITLKGKTPGSGKLEFKDGTRAAGQQEAGNVIAFKSSATVTVKASGQPTSTIITPTTTPATTSPSATTQPTTAPSTGTTNPQATAAPAAGGPAATATAKPAATATAKPAATTTSGSTTSPSSIGKPTVSLPSNKTVVPGATISGTAAPNSTVTITIQSDPITATVKANSAGKWTYTLPVNLAVGSHTLTITDSNGTYTTQFTVSDSIPEAGFSLPFFAAIFIGFSLLILGAFVNIRSSRA